MYKGKGVVLFEDLFCDFCHLLNALSYLRKAAKSSNQFFSPLTLKLNPFSCNCCRRTKPRLLSYSGPKPSTYLGSDSPIINEH